MILGTQIDWKTCLYTLKEIDEQLIRNVDTQNKSLDYKTFITLFNKAFPGHDAKEHIFCSAVFKAPTPESALSIALLFHRAANNDCIICMTGNLVIWVQALVTILSDSFSSTMKPRVYEPINEYFCEQYRVLNRIDDNLFKDYNLIRVKNNVLSLRVKR